MFIIGTISSSDKSVPNAPTIGTATDVGTGRTFASGGRADVTFTAPAFTGRLPITSYTVRAYNSSNVYQGFTATGSSSPITVTGMTPSSQYKYTVLATNSVGNSVESGYTGLVTATTVPQAPTIGTATDGGTGTAVSVAFSAPANNGGTAITGYTATSSPGGFTGTGASSPITVSGLTAGTAYTFTVTATNANGISAASAASNSVTPQFPGSFESIATVIGNGTSNVATFSSIPSTYKHLQLRINLRSTGGGFFIRFNGDTGANYARHWVQGYNESTTSSGGSSETSISLSQTLGVQGEDFPYVLLIDIIDYASTAKLKVLRSMQGTNATSSGSSETKFQSGLWNSTSAISSITFQNGNNFSTGTSVALYGIKG